MTDNEYDIGADETHTLPDCDDCGGFRVKEWNPDRMEWICPACFPEPEEEEPEEE
tara:strand:+ start:1224 stop:1388 length:165 start_codon:yes stop_codon:yes gene_type:complete